MQKKYLTWGLMIFCTLIIALIVALYSLSTGELRIPLFKIPAILMHGKGSIEFTILNNIRLPRIVFGFAIGGALSLAGVILQGVYRNPLVEPYTLGISGGAAIGVAISIVFGLHLTQGINILPVSGFAGALTTTFLVYMLSLKQGKLLIHKMILMGVMISFIASSLMMFLLATTKAENLHNIIFWIMGSLDESNSGLIYLSVIVSVLCLIASYLFIQPLNALRLGEEKARHLGINTDVTIKLLFLISSLLTGLCVSVAGIIGFVGLIIPQLVRLMIGNDFRILLLISFITGGGFLVFCDTIARTIISPNELPIGVITGMLGGIVFVVVLTRTKSISKLAG